jgi:putative peptidoglycan lipid II flippase
VATTLSKGMGFLRQLLIAALFGSGPEYSAFAIAYVLPGFLLILLGGINGPFHSAIVSVLKKRSGQDQARWLESISTLVGMILLGVTLLLVLAADLIVQWIAPGSSAAVHHLAAEQLRIMAPLALFSGLIGIGFGTLNAADRFLLPALSPLLSSLAVILALLSFGRTGHASAIAWGTLIGAVAQWAIQVPLQAKLGLGKPRLRFDWGSPHVRSVGLLMLPAVISSGMVHINVYVDMFFASFVPGDRTIGNLGYAQLLVQTPLGILSNMVLVPLMPLFASLAVPERWPELRQRVQQGLVTTAVLILPLSMLLAVLARPIVQMAYQRGQFTAEVTQEVAALLTAYAVGMAFYLLRDVVVRIFYALEDGRTPLQISVVAIFLNAGLDTLGLEYFGAPGLALATAAVNAIALIWLCVALHRRLELSWAQLLRSLGLLTLCTGLATGTTWIVWWLVQSQWPSTGFLALILQTSLAATAGLGVFGLTALWTGISEVKEVMRRIQTRWQRQSA